MLEMNKNYNVNSELSLWNKKANERMIKTNFAKWVREFISILVHYYLLWPPYEDECNFFFLSSFKKYFRTLE